MSKRIEFVKPAAVDRLGKRANEARDGEIEEVIAGTRIVSFLLKNDRVSKADFLVLECWLSGAAEYPPNTEAIVAGQTLVNRALNVTQ